MKRSLKRKSREPNPLSFRGDAAAPPPLFSLLRMTPKRVVGAVATCVVLLLLFGGDIRGLLTGHYHPRITFERGARAATDGTSRRANQPATREAVFDGEVYRTESRLREASAVAVAASLAGIGGSFEQRPVRNVEELLDGIVSRKLLPPGVELVRERKLLVSEHSTIHVRFRPEPLGVEVVSLGRERIDGPGLVVRVPDEPKAQNNRQRYFYSFRLENVTPPEAFANLAAMQAAGWQIDYLGAQLPEGANAEQLAAWTRSRTP